MALAALPQFFSIPLFLGFFSAATPINSKHPDAIDCAQFSSDLDAYEPCVQDFAHGFPKLVGPTQVSIYTDTAVIESEDTDTITHQLELISDVVDDIWPEYSNYSLPVRAISIKLTTPFSDGTTAANTDSLSSATPLGDTCYIRFAMDNTVIPQGARRNIAHELYHCVQFRLHQVNDYSMGWLWEGTAEFFAEQHYPSSDLTDFDKIRYYWPEKSLCGLRYTAALFWTYLKSQGFDNWAINAVVATMPILENDANHGRTSMAGSIIANYFPTFATAFVNQLIKYPDGTTIPNYATPDPDLWAIALPKDGDWAYVEVEVNTFAIHQYEIQLPAGQTIKMTFESDDPLATLWYRKAGEQDWNNPWSLSNDPVEIATDCGGTSIQVVYTSTADQETSVGQLTFVREWAMSC